MLKWLAVVYILHHVLDSGITDEDLLNVEFRFLWDEIHASFSLLLLELQGDVSNRTLLDSLHEMSDESSDLVSKALGRDDCDLLADLLVQLEVKSELLVVLLDNVSGRSLNGLCSNSSHLEITEIAYRSGKFDEKNLKISRRCDG